MSFRTLLAAALLTSVGFSAQAAEPEAQTIRKAPAQELKTVAPEAATPKAKRQPADAGAAKGSAAKKRPQAEITQETTPPVLTTLKPDLVVEVSNPSAPGQPAEAIVRNVGGAATQSSFTVVSTIESWCEVGKLKAPVPTNDGSQVLAPIPAGSFRYVFVRPSSQTWADNGCYYYVKVRADSWEQIAETNDTNNTGTAHFCPAGASCY